MKKKMLICISSIIMLCIIGGIFAFRLNSVETVIFEDKNIKNEQAWRNFINKSSKKEKCKIKIKIGEKDDENRILKYDGDKYNYSVDDNESYYNYLLEVEGKEKMAASKSKFIVLANDKYDFETISKSIYSNSTKDHVPYQLIYCY